MTSKKLSSIADLTPDPQNANRGTKRGLGLLDNSLRQYGAGRSILADKNGTVIAGNKTLERAADLGMEVVVVPSDGTKLIVVQRTDLDIDSKQGRELAYADNRVAQVDLDWNPDQLLADVAAGIDLPALFGRDDLDEILKQAAGYAPAADDPGADIDRAAELQAKWGTSLGQLWQIGRHRLLCGDCTVRENVERVMGGERADATVTDPPYGVGVDYGGFDDTAANVRDLVSKFMPIVMDYLPAALTPGVPAMWDYPRPAWVGAWVHPATTSSGAWGFVGSNPILYYGKDPYLATGKGRRDSSTVMVADRKSEDDHPVSKPLGVWAWLVERMTPERDMVVFDPFLGSGTTLVACEQLGRIGRGLELSPAYCAVILERLAGMGLKPELLR